MRNSFFFSRARVHVYLCVLRFIVFLKRIGYFVNFFIVFCHSMRYDNLKDCYDLLLHYIVVNDMFLYFWENQNLILKN